MQLTLDAFDVLNAAIMLEERGARFYSEAAAACSSDEKKLLMRLAEMEKGHAQTFRGLLEKAAKRTASRPPLSDPESREYLEAMTSDRIITEGCAFAKGDDYGQILAKAMLIEKNSVFFYTAVKSSLSEKMSVEQIDHLISEEVGHFQMLSNAQAKWRNRAKNS